MKDPKRLLEEGASELEQSLLHAALAEPVPHGAEQRLAAVLGLSSFVLPASAASTSVAPPSMPPALGGAGMASALGGGATKALVGKLLLTGLLLAASGTLLNAVVPRRPSGVGTQQSTKLSPPVKSRATAPREGVASSAPQSSDGASSGDSASLAREVASLDAVRALLQQRRAAAALTALARYEAVHTRPMLAQEATLLRIEALLQTGASREARALAERFLQEHQDSPHVTRVRALLRTARRRP